MEMWPLWLACFYLWFLPISPELQRFEHPIEADGSIRCLVIGDWGRRGRYNQSQIAFQMGRTGEELNIDFVVSTGDNFYQNGLKSLNDPSLAESFTKVYTAKSLQKQWYSVLGNHDYRGNVEVQLSPILRKKDNRWFCRRSYILNTEIAEFFFVDTTPFVDKYFLKQKHTYDWRGVIPRKKYLTELSEDLESALRDSTANWKIVIGHHTIRSIGHHGDTEELVGQLLPILEANNVDMYINGHDHCLQHISSTRSPIEFFTSGGGSKAWKGDINEMNQDKMKFYYDGQGFMSLELTKTNAKDPESALRDSAANWKIVIGHHNIRSIGHQVDTEELVRQLLPILEANNVDMYINGHDHCLQHISSTRSPIEFFNGGGWIKEMEG